MGVVDTASTDIETIGMLMGGRRATATIEQTGI
jgi:hypothetical protein